MEQFLMGVRVIHRSIMLTGCICDILKSYQPYLWITFSLCGMRMYIMTSSKGLFCSLILNGIFVYEIIL